MPRDFLSFWREISYLARLGYGSGDSVRLSWASVRFHMANSLGLSKHLLDRPAEFFPSESPRASLSDPPSPVQWRLVHLFEHHVWPPLCARRRVGEPRSDGGRSRLPRGFFYSFAGAIGAARSVLLPGSEIPITSPCSPIIWLVSVRGRESYSALWAKSRERLRSVTIGFSWGGSVDGHGLHTYEVPAYTISQVIEKAGFPVVDVLKVHVEGAEGCILQEPHRAALARVR